MPLAASRGCRDRILRQSTPRSCHEAPFLIRLLDTFNDPDAKNTMSTTDIVGNSAIEGRTGYINKCREELAPVDRANMPCDHKDGCQPKEAVKHLTASEHSQDPGDFQTFGALCCHHRSCKEAGIPKQQCGVFYGWDLLTKTGVGPPRRGSLQDPGIQLF